MTKDICLSTMLSTTAFQKQQAMYVEYTSLLRESTISPTTYLEIREVAQKRVEALNNLKTNMQKLAGLIPPDSYKKLISSIENEEALASMLASDCEQFLETQDSKFEESILAGLAEEQEYSANLSESLSMVERQVSISIVGGVLNNRFTLKEIRQMAGELEKDSFFYKQLDDLANYMERTQTREKQDTNEQTVRPNVQAVEAKPITREEQPSMKPLVGQGSAKPKEPTLADKIAGVMYSSDGNMVAEVQELTVEERMAQIAKALEGLSGKEKLSLKDMIQIHTLQEEQVQLEAYVDALENQKLSRREVKRNKKMEIVNSKIEENQQLIAKSMENSKQYKSKIMRFLSARYQYQLGNQIVELREKRGTLQREQRMSAVAKFNKNSGKMMRSSRVLGTIKGMSQFKNAKLDELRALRDQVMAEFGNLRQDIGRFTSRRDMINELQQSNVIMLDQPMSLEEHQRVVSQSLAA